MKQANLFAWAKNDSSPSIPNKARSTDPETSHAAAASVQGRTKTHTAILQILKAKGPSTDEEIFRSLKDIGVLISSSGARTRRSELVALKKVGFYGDFRLTEAGRNSRVWEITR